MKECIKCNESIEINANFCHQCGILQPETKLNIDSENNFTAAIDKNEVWIDEELGLKIRQDKLFFIDTRDNKEYPLFMTDQTIWFAKNLAIKKGEFNIKNTEVLYKNISDDKDIIVPKSWYLPNIADWNNLSSFIANKTDNYHPLINKYAVVSHEHSYPYDILKCIKEDGEYLQEDNLYQLVDLNKDNHIMVYDISRNLLITHDIGGSTYFDPRRFNLVLHWQPALYNPPVKSGTVRDLSFIHPEYRIIKDYFGLNYDYSSFYIDSGVNNCLQIFEHEPLCVSKTNLNLSIRCFMPITDELKFRLEKLDFQCPAYIKLDEIKDFSGLDDDSYKSLYQFDWLFTQYRKKKE